jgi:asparagine synthase (glutamine-hydrolysing)
MDPSAGLRQTRTWGFLTNRPELWRRVGLGPGTSDGELVAALYAQDREDLLRHLCGPFAFVLKDEGRGLLFAASDRMGAHGLFYSELNGRLRISDRVDDLLASHQPPRLNPNAVALHLVGHPPPLGETFFRGIHSLPPASALLSSPTRRGLWRYWHAETPTSRRKPTLEQSAGALRSLLIQVVDEYVEAKPCGITLSSGLDSTSVAAAATHRGRGPKPVALLWSAREFPEADESAGARAVQTHLGLEGVEIPVGHLGPLAQEVSTQVLGSSPLCGFFAPAWEATFSAAREHGLRTLLSGFSGDHLFGGDVFSYPDLLLTGRWLRLAREFRAHSRFSSFSAPELARRTILLPIFDAWLQPELAAFTSPSPWISSSLGERLRIFEPPRRVGLFPGRVLRLRWLGDPMISTTAQYLTRRASAWGIELRHPLIDHRLVELAAAIPVEHAYEAGLQKAVLRHAMRGLLPETTLAQTHKVYPAAIARSSLRTEQQRVQDLMRGMRAAELGFIDEAKLRAAYAEFHAGRSLRTTFWHALTLEAWLRRYFPA